MKLLQENIKNLLTWVLVIIFLEITPKAQATNFFKSEARFGVISNIYY